MKSMDSVGYSLAEVIELKDYFDHFHASEESRSKKFFKVKKDDSSDENLHHFERTKMD